MLLKILFEVYLIFCLFGLSMFIMYLIGEDERGEKKRSKI